MNELKKIIYNCKKATLLIEKKQVGTLTLRERLELRIHLAGCDVCKLFQKQSIIINRMIRQLFHGASNEIKLGNDFKMTLQDRIEKELKNK